MVFKNFRFQIILRVIILVVTIVIGAWCLVNTYYLRSIYAVAAVVIIVVELIWYVDRFNRDIKSFLIGLLQHDFTTHFQSKGHSKSFDELYETLNTISGVFKTISAEKELQYRYLEMLVEHLRVGILGIDENGKINIANKAVKDLLQKDVLFSLRSMDTFDPSLVNTLRDIRSGETRLLKLPLQDKLLQLSIHASEFMLEEKYHKLISMQNIRNELDAQEMEAWQKLIRVLTHEIMNSVSPLISLSDTMHGAVKQNRQFLNQQDAAVYDTLDKGLDAIRSRSEGLYQFTQSYRKLTGIPKLSVQETSTRQLFSRVKTLMENTMQAKNIKLKISDADIPLRVDPDLMEHVLINLLLNAMEAVAKINDPTIEVGTSRNAKGDVLIYVRDNGEGMDEATAEKIFIPFFTTRKNGSGIGLALTKQILQLHHANIHFTTSRGEGTEFVITL